jgi:hypothetical protein
MEDGWGSSRISDWWWFFEEGVERGLASVAVCDERAEVHIRVLASHVGAIDARHWRFLFRIASCMALKPWNICGSKLHF